MGKPGDIIAGVRFKADLFRLIVKQSEHGKAGDFSDMTLEDRKELLKRIEEEDRAMAAKPKLEVVRKAG